MITFSSSDLHEFELDNTYGDVASPSFEVDSPKFSLSKLRKLRDKIFHALEIESNSFGEKITISVLRQISILSCVAIRLPASCWDLVEESLYSYLTMPVNKMILGAIAARISGNVDILKDGKVIPEWKNVDIPLWVPVEVVKVEAFYGVFTGKRLTVFITAGVPAGCTTSQCVSNKFIQFMLREIGYPKYHKYSPEEIFNTRFTCNITKDSNRIKMVAFAVSSSQKNHNHVLYKLRHGECPHNNQLECPVCLKGLQTCPGALHRKEYVVGDCVNGHRGILETGSDVCNSCLDRELRETAKKLLERKSHGDPRTLYADSTKG